MKVYLIIFLSLLPILALSKNSKGDYSDVKNTGLYAFLTETYKPVSSFKDLPANTLAKLEEFEKGAQEQSGSLILDKNGHFPRLRLDSAGISKKSCYVFFQSSGDPVYHYLGVLQKRSKGFYVSFYTDLPFEIHDTSLNHLRDMVLEGYRRDTKFGMIDIHWTGDYKNGWINRKRNLRIWISKDFRSINLENLNGKVIWNYDVIGIMEKRGMWDEKDATDRKLQEMTYPKEISPIEIGDREIHCFYAGRCFGVIDLMTGEFNDEGCD